MIKKLKIGLLIAVLSLAVGVGSANATANLTWSAATTIDLSSPDIDDMTIASGSTASALVVEAGDIIVTADTTVGATFTVSSASRTLVPSSATGVTQTCASGVSQIVIAASTDALTISTTAPQCGTSSGGGGGGTTAADTTAPTGTVSINAGATTTTLLAATLTLSATDTVGVTQMLISNDSGFAGASWETYATSKAWTLTSGDGVKTVYAKFRDAALNVSGTVSDTITVSGTGTVAVPPTEPVGGCSGGNLYNASTGALCVNNAGAEIPGCGNRTTGFSSASGVSCVNNRVTLATTTYNFGTKTLKNGSKGEGVKELQRFLNAKLNLGLVIDGKLGPKTIAVIKKWQKEKGLVADGLVGAKTKAKMNAEAD